MVPGSQRHIPTQKFPKYLPRGKSLPISVNHDFLLVTGIPSVQRRTYSSAKNKKAQDSWSKEKEKLLGQLWAENNGFAGNRTALTAWRDVLFTDFVLKCDCSFPDKFFVTGRFQVGFVQNKSEIVL